MRRWRHAIALLLTVAGAGCAAAPSPSASLPARPPMPEGWRIVTSDEGDVTGILPREFVVTSTAGGISGAPALDAPASASWRIIGPAAHAIRSGESIDDAVKESGLLTGQADGAELGVFERRERPLPGGAAIEYRAAYTVDGRDAWTILYAIEVGADVAIVRFGGDGPVPDDLADELALVRDLLAFPRHQSAPP